MWLGTNCVRWFVRPSGELAEGSRCYWFTNLDHAKRHRPLILTEKYSPDKYPTYDNYNAINVDKTKDIPCDYYGIIGVPVTYLDKHCPEQFEIVGATESEGKGFSAGLWTGGVAQATVAGHKVYKRLFIKRRTRASLPPGGGVQ
jgi:hypothetical protein